jgi:hypothetical protein
MTAPIDCETAWHTLAVLQVSHEADAAIDAAESMIRYCVELIGRAKKRYPDVQKCFAPMQSTPVEARSGAPAVYRQPPGDA